MTIRGSGPMANYGSDIMTPWNGKVDRIERVVVEEGVTTISDDAFYWCRNLTSVSLPSTLESIGYNAFYNCTALTSVNIPEGVTSIGICAFQNCPKLKAVTIPGSVTELMDDCFGILWSRNAESGESILTKVEGFTITAPRASEGYFYAKENGFACIENGFVTPEFIDAGLAQVDLKVYPNIGIDLPVVGTVAKGEHVHPYRTVPGWGRIMGYKDGSGSITWGELSEEILSNSGLELVSGWVMLDNVKLKGSCGEKLTWEISGSTLTISGTGKMDYFMTQ